MYRVQHSHYWSIFIECYELAISRFRLIKFHAEKSPYEYVHSVRIGLAKLILVGTRITYQPTGDAGLYMAYLHVNFLRAVCTFLVDALHYYCSCTGQRMKHCSRGSWKD